MASPATVPVLAYHSVSARSTRAFAALTIAPALFDEHLAALRESGAEVIRFAEVPHALSAGRRNVVAISLDDGLADAASHAAPALQRHGATATLFVPSGYVGGRAEWLPGEEARRPMLSWTEIGELARAGFEIGSHGRMHLAADVNPVELVRRDAVASRSELEQRAGTEVRSFAYPFGYHSGAARRAIRDVGFAQACVVGGLPARAGDDRWALPRLLVTGGTTAEQLLHAVQHRPRPTTRRWMLAKQGLWHVGRRWAGWGPPEARRARESAR